MEAKLPSQLKEGEELDLVFNKITFVFLHEYAQIEIFIPSPGPGKDEFRRVHLMTEPFNDGKETADNLFRAISDSIKAQTP